MKTTVEVADALLSEAKAAARREGATLRSLIEEGLRYAIGRRQPGKRKRFKLADGSFKGRGMNRAYAGKWTKIRDEIYRGRT